MAAKSAAGPAARAVAASVADRLRDDIRRGVFPPGERLIELQLSERYGVGRAAVRSALVELDAQGLVRRGTQPGGAGPRINVGEAVEITEARVALESLVARRAAERATDADCKELEGLVEEMTAAVEEGRKQEYSALNRRLHAALPRIARHTVADDLIHNLRDRAVHHQFQLSLVPGRAAESLAQHRAIVAAVVAGDGDAAASAMRGHLESVIDALREWEYLDTRGT